MPQNLRRIRRKIRAVTNIEQITRAMKMVAAARLSQVQQRVETGKAYTERLRELTEEVAAAVKDDFSHPYLEPRPEPQTVGVLLVAGDRGLCGSHNVNLFRAANECLGERAAIARVMTVGSKAAAYAQRRGLQVIHSFAAPSGHGAFNQATQIARFSQRLFEGGEIETLEMIHTSFVSVVRHEPTVTAVLPVPPKPESGRRRRQYIFEPPAPELLGQLLPQAVEAEIVQMLMESEASEQAARMTAMAAATENAEEMITRLTRQLNRARQYAITAEMLEIMGGAEALATAE